jgi:16S rRNA (guanine527-N7)-methyltransferase
MYKKIFINCLTKLSINLTSDQINLLLTYWETLLNTNNIINLISRKGLLEDKIINHLVDSVTPLMFTWPNKLKVMDFGSGGGLPGIPLKICRPDWHVTLVESSSKKAMFLNKACLKLNLNDCIVVNEYIDKKHSFYNEKFDLITSRAVGKINELIPIISTFLKPQGIFLIYKGPKIDLEIKDYLSLHYENILKLYKTDSFLLPLVNSQRNLIYFKKL